MQAAELRHDQEQEEDDRAAGAEQVLPLLSQAHGAQGDQVVQRSAISDQHSASTRRIFLSELSAECSKEDILITIQAER
jgi:hypothetical protein